MEFVGTLLLFAFSFGVLGPGLWFYLGGLNGHVGDRYVSPSSRRC